MAGKGRRAAPAAEQAPEGVTKAPTRYALFQRREQLVRPHARALIQAWEKRWGLEAGLDEEKARAAGVVYLVGPGDFFPARPFAHGCEVYRVCPRGCEDPDDTEAVLHAVLHGMALPAVELDPRAREEG
jgi:hypothetical protein